jgi:hypothetical protein
LREQVFFQVRPASLPVGVQAAIASGLTSTLTEGKPDLKSAALSGIISQAAPSLKGYGLEVAGANIPYGEAGSTGEHFQKFNRCR